MFSLINKYNIKQIKMAMIDSANESISAHKMKNEKLNIEIKELKYTIKSLEEENEDKEIELEEINTELK